MLIGLMPHIGEGIERAVKDGEPRVGAVPDIGATLFGPLDLHGGSTFALVFVSTDAKVKFMSTWSRIACAGKQYDPFQDLSHACGEPVVLVIECLPG